MARNKEKAKKKATKKTFMLIVFTVFCIVTLHLTFLFAIVGMLPAFVAYFIDKGDNRGVFHSVFACNLSGTLAVIVPLIARGNDVAILNSFMADGTNWLIMYASAAFGWVLVYGCPHVGQLFIDFVHGKKLLKLNTLNKKLEGEWGDTIAYKDRR